MLSLAHRRSPSACGGMRGGTGSGKAEGAKAQARHKLVLACIQTETSTCSDLLCQNTMQDRDLLWFS